MCRGNFDFSVMGCYTLVVWTFSNGFSGLGDFSKIKGLVKLLLKYCVLVLAILIKKKFSRVCSVYVMK